MTDAVAGPLQEKMEDWRKSAAALDKDHCKERKKIQVEARQLCSEIRSAQTKVRKGKRDARSQLDCLLAEKDRKRISLEELERRAVTGVLVEERIRFCTLVGCLKPIADTEALMAVEMTSIQEVVDSLCLLATEPCLLPASSQQVIDDCCQTQCKWFCQTPPGSRSGSPRELSHRSSMCSINSSSRSSPSSPGAPASPAHSAILAAAAAQHRITLQPDTLHVVCDAGSSTISSLDSGFVSQDAYSLHSGYHDGILLQHIHAKKCQPDGALSPSAWTNWAADSVSDHHGHRSFQGQNSRSPPAPVSPVLQQHPSLRMTRSHGDECQMSPLANGAECRLSSPLSPPRRTRTNHHHQLQQQHQSAGLSAANDVSPLSGVIDNLHQNTATLDSLFSDKGPAESYDDFDTVMRKLELSAMSLAEVASVSSRNSRSLVPAAAGMVQTSPGVDAAGASRRTSINCRPPSPSPTVAGRSKPPPPVRRTSSVTGTYMIPAASTDLDGGLNSVPHGVHGSPSRPRSIAVGRHSAAVAGLSARSSPSVRVSPLPPRQSLASTYAELCHTLNDQLAVGGAVHRPGGQRSDTAGPKGVVTEGSRGGLGERRQSATVETGSSTRSDDTLLVDIRRAGAVRSTSSTDRASPAVNR